MNTPTHDAEIDVARLVCARLDSRRPEINDLLAPSRRGDDMTAACAFIRYLRARPSPVLPVTLEARVRLRSHVTAAECRDARSRIERLLAAESITNGGHGVSFTTLGERALLAVVDEALCLRMAAKVLAARDAEWASPEWGITRSLCQLITRLMVTDECPDRALVPFFGWLLVHAEAEWRWARGWDESKLGNTGHNWWLHTFLGFFQAGLYFPEFCEFRKFQSLAPEYFEYEIRNLMAGDGFTRERSGYHWGTADLFYDYLHVADANGLAVSDAFWERVRRMARAHWQLLSPNGDVPRFGDAGAGYRPGVGLTRLREIAAWLGVPEAKFVMERLAPESPAPASLPCWGNDWADAYRRLTATPPPGETADAVLPETGYYVMRRDWSPASDWVCLDAGPTGSIVTSHTHTHIFHFELYARGRAILIDNGSGPYGDSPERMWREGSASHNVAMVDHADHVPILNEWRWKAEVTPVVNDWRSTPAFAYFSGAHEGYNHLPAPVASSRRKLFYLRGGYWILIDRFTPTVPAEHIYEQHFHLGAPHTLSGDGSVRTHGPGGNLAIIPVDGACGEASVTACECPLDGYDNPAHLRYTRRTADPGLFVTVLVPFADDRAPDVVVERLPVEADDRAVSPWEITALAITIDGQRDVYVDQHMQWSLTWRAGGYRDARRLFHSRIV